MKTQPFFIYVVSKSLEDEGIETLCFKVEGTKETAKTRAEEFFSCVDVLECFVSTQEDGLEKGVNEDLVIHRDKKSELYQYLN